MLQGDYSRDSREIMQQEGVIIIVEDNDIKIVKKIV